MSHLTRPDQSTKLERVGDTEELAAAMHPQVVYDKVIEEPEAMPFEQPSWKQVKVVTMDLKPDSFQNVIRKKNEKIVLKASSLDGEHI